MLRQAQRGVVAIAAGRRQHVFGVSDAQQRVGLEIGR